MNSEWFIQVNLWFNDMMWVMSMFKFYFVFRECFYRIVDFLEILRSECVPKIMMTVQKKEYLDEKKEHSLIEWWVNSWSHCFNSCTFHCQFCIYIYAFGAYSLSVYHSHSFSAWTKCKLFVKSWHIKMLIFMLRSGNEEVYMKHTFYIRIALFLTSLDCFESFQRWFNTI